MKAAADRDYDAAVGYLTDDIEYQNMPLPPVNGKEAVKATPSTCCWRTPRARSGSCIASSRPATSS